MEFHVFFKWKEKNNNKVQRGENGSTTREQSGGEEADQGNGRGTDWNIKCYTKWDHWEIQTQREEVTQYNIEM